jgi:hypothetical protein
VSRRERWPNRGSGSGSSIHSYMLLAGFGTDTVVVYCQYVFVWHVDPGKEKMLTASSTFDTLTFIYWGLLSIILKRLPHGRGLVPYYQMTGWFVPVKVRHDPDIASHPARASPSGLSSKWPPIRRLSQVNVSYWIPYRCPWLVSGTLRVVGQHPNKG